MPHVVQPLIASCASSCLAASIGYGLMRYVVHPIFQFSNGTGPLIGSLLMGDLANGKVRRRSRGRRRKPALRPRAAAGARAGER